MFDSVNKMLPTLNLRMSSSLNLNFTSSEAVLEHRKFTKSEQEYIRAKMDPNLLMTWSLSAISMSKSGDGDESSDSALESSYNTNQGLIQPINQSEQTEMNKKSLGVHSNIGLIRTE